ncbi:MAG: OmpH family outer membrane protein [Pirellulaceae bacterium]
MRVSHLIATFVAGASLVGAASVLAQAPAGQQTAAAQSTGKPGTSVAVVDIKFIFDNLHGFKAAMDRIKQEYDAFEAGVRDTETQLRKRIDELKSLTPGSDEYKRIEEEITQRRAQVQLDIKRKQTQRVEDEAKVYHRAFQDVERTIASFAQRYGFDLVLQFSTSEIDPSKPDTVIRGLNRLVIYQNRLNITQYVLDELNRMSPAPTGVTSPSGVPAPSGVTAPTRPLTGPRTAFPPAAPGTTRK